MADYSVKLDVDSSAALAGIRGVQSQVGRLTDAFTNLRRVASQISIATVITQANSLANALVGISRASDISLSTVKQFYDAISTVGGNGREATAKLIEFTSTLQEARKGSADLQTTLRNAGISIEDLATLSDEQILRKLVGNLDAMNDSGKRNIISFKLLGEEFKKISFRDFARSFGGAAPNVSSITAASDAQRALIVNLENLRQAVLNVIEPLNKLVASINISTERFESAIQAILAIAGAFLFLKKVLPVVQGGLIGFIGLMDRFKSLTKMVFAAIASTGLVSGFIQNARAVALAFTMVGSVGQKIIVVMGLYAAAVSRVGAALLILVAAHQAIKAIFDVDLVKKAADAWASLKEKMGFGDSEAKKLMAWKESANALDIDNQSIAQGYNDDLRERKQVLDDIQRTIKSQAFDLRGDLDTIERQNIALSRGLQLDLAALRMSEDQVDLRRRLLDIDTQRMDAIAGLQRQIIKLKLDESLGVEDPARAAKIALLNEAIGRTNNLYSAQAQAVTSLLPLINKQKMLDAARAKDMENLTESINRRISAEGRLRDILRGVDEQTKAARRAREDMGITIYETQIREIARQNQDAMEAAQRDFAGEFSDFDILSPEQIERFNTGMDQITSKFRELTRIQGENLGRSRTWTQGWADAFKDFEESATNAATIARDVFTTFTSSIEGALDSFVRNGKMKFKDFVRDVARDLLSLAVKIQFRQLLLASGTMKPGGLFGSLFSGLGGGGGPATLAAIPGFATGGYIPPGRIGMVGERGPELISGPAQITPMDRMGMGSGTVTNNYYTINAVDARSVAQLFSENRISLLGAVRAAEKSLPGGGMR